MEAPRRESNTDPRKPDEAMISSEESVHPKVPMKRSAMRKDDAAPAASPSAVMPPERPLGTFVNVSIDTGSEWLRRPISPEKVSASASAIAAAKAMMNASGYGDMR